MVEGSPHLHERKAGHVDDYTRRTVRKAWEGLGRAPERAMWARRFFIERRAVDVPFGQKIHNIGVRQTETKVPLSA